VLGLWLNSRARDAGHIALFLTRYWKPYALAGVHAIQAKLQKIMVPSAEWKVPINIRPNGSTVTTGAYWLSISPEITTMGSSIQLITAARMMGL